MLLTLLLGEGPAPTEPELLCLPSACRPLAWPACGPSERGWLREWWGEGMCHGLPPSY